jgi:hypothetical protein
VLAKSLDDIEVAPIDGRLKPILRYVRKLTETPSRMTAADAAAVYDAGWNDEALLHAIAVCAYFNNMNRLVEGAGIVGTSEDYAMAARRLVEHGYLRGTAPRKKARASQNASQKSRPAAPGRRARQKPRPRRGIERSRDRTDRAPQGGNQMPFFPSLPEDATGGGASWAR